MNGRTRARMAFFLLATVMALPPLASARIPEIPPPLIVNQDSPWHTAYPLLQLASTRPDSGQVTAQLTTANVFHLQKSRDESIELDGEIQSLNLAFAHTLNDQWDFTLRARWQRHDPGLWDSVIEHWHDFFHLPNGGRELRDPERLYYSYENDNQTIRVSSASPGWQALTVELGFTRPTPDGQSGRWQVAAGYTRAQQPTLGGDRLQLHGGYTHGWRLDDQWTAQIGAGLSFLPADQSALNERRARLRGQLRSVLGWQPLAHATLLAQLDTHTPLYDSRVAPLGTLPLILTLAARYKSGRHLLEAGFGEDLNPGASPDWSTHLTWRYPW